MFNKFATTCLLISTVLSPYAYADTVSWASWVGQDGSFVQDGKPIDVSYSGQYAWTDFTSGIFDDVPGSFTNAVYTNTPGSNGTIALTGTGEGRFTFSHAVTNPLLALWSVGQPGYQVRFVFDTSNFEIVSEGAGHWGGGSLVQDGNRVTGEEGNGLIQFYGSYTSIHFQLPDYEYYYGATIGAPTSAVPPPGSIWLMGSTLLGLLSLKRHNA
ncbi:hypothetical protein [Methylomonas rhizoryzae]|uniref:hypothetical protein n=2 Tax=Methylomonas TaxID=416 RepID=UPI0012327A1C|nr:hypothetical protein [Methylomonas rhizoryzae]